MKTDVGRLIRGSVLVLLSALLSLGTAFAQGPQKSPPQPTAEIKKLIDDAQKLPPKERLAALEKVLPVAKAKNDVAGETVVNMYCGISAGSTGLIKESLAFFQEALRLSRGFDSPTAEAIILTDIGLVNSMLGEHAKAVGYYARALPIQQRVGDLAGQARTLNNLALTYYDLGEHEQALEYDVLALPIERQVKDQNLEAITLNNLGLVYNVLGQKSKALDSFELALPLEQKTGNLRLEAVTLMGIGICYSALGQKEKALTYDRKALSLSQDVGDKRAIAETLNNIANIFGDIGQISSALDYFSLALPIRREVDDRIGEAFTLTGIGQVYMKALQPAKALDYYQRALPIERAVGARQVEAETLGSAGKAYVYLGNRAKAQAFWDQALPMEREVGDRDGEATTLGYLMALVEKSDPSLAIWYGKRSVNLYQSLRKDISTLDRDVQQSYKESVAKAYRNLADLLAKQGRISEAEQVLRLLKDDELFHYVRRSDVALAGGKAEYTPAENSWDKEYEAQTTELADTARQAEDLRRSPQPDQAKLKGLMAKLEDGEVKFQKFLDRVLEKSKTLNVQENRIERIQEAQSISDTLAVLPKGTVAVYALAAPDALRLFYFAPGTSVGRVSNIKAEDLNKKVLAFREALTDPSADPRPLGKEFYDLLIKPIEKDLAGSKAKRIMWSLDGMLRYVPIAALYDGKQFLIEKYDVSIFTPAGSARLERNPKTSWKALAAGVSLAHVVKDDDGTTHSFAALAGVPRELAGVMKALPGSTTLLDQSFTLVNFKDALNRRPNLVHLATHFSFRPGDETRSYLLTGDGKPLKVADARELSTLSLQGVSLLTLSACETALGGSDGSEVEGISAVLQKKGAEAVVATLWPVADSSTANLMAEFYRLRNAHPDWSKLHALQTSQVELLKGQLAVKNGPTRSEAINGQTKNSWPKNLPQYSHPYYWAPFVLMGNWK